MPDAMSFEDLRDARAELQEAVARHRASVLWFKHPKRPWFVRQASDRDREIEAPNPPAVSHLSSTATCFESLHDPLGPRTDTHSTDLASFSTHALSLNPDAWASEQAAYIYCRVRTLTPILAMAPDDVIADRRIEVKALVNEVWAVLNPWDTDRQGIGELPQSGAPSEDAYPPNAFHTYWAIRLLEQWDQRKQILRPVPVELGRKRAVAELWSYRMWPRRPRLSKSERSGWMHTNWPGR